MELVELVTQGLQGAPEMVRLPFTPTVTVLAASPRERLYVRLVLDLLYPKGTEPTLFDLDTKNAQSRVALTVQGRDGQRYRLLQDVHTGRRALQKVVGDKAEPVTNAANEIAQAVTATIGFPQEDVMRELMFCVREDLPSQRIAAPFPTSSSSSSSSKKKSSAPKKEKSINDGKPLPPGFSDEGAPVADRGGRSDADLKRRLAEIDALLGAQAGVKDLEFEIDGLQKKVFEIESRLRPLATLRRSVEQAEAQMQRFHSVEKVPADIIEKGALLRQAEADHKNALNKIDAERDRLLESSGTLDRRGRQAPLDVAQRDPLVRYGVAVGAGSIALALVGAVSWPALQWVAFLDIPAFAVALFGGIRVLGSLEHGESVRRRVERIDLERKRLDDKLRVDQEHVKSILDRAGFAIEQLDDVQDQIRAREEGKIVLEQTRAALREAEQGGDMRALEAEQKEMSTRIKALEEQLQTNTGYGGAADLEQEKAEIQSILRNEVADKTVDDADVDPVDPTIDESGDVDIVEVEDLCRRQLELARDVLLAASVEDVAKQVKSRASQIFSALADGRFKEMRFGGRGEMSAVDAAAGQALPFGRLPPFDRDLAWLALKVALVEVVVKQQRLPVIFDRGLDAIADSKGPLLKNMLSFLSQATQVVSISEKPSLGGRT